MEINISRKKETFDTFDNNIRFKSLENGHLIS